MPCVLTGRSFGRDLRESVGEPSSSSSSGMLRSRAAGIAVLEVRSSISGSKISNFGGISVNPGSRFAIWKLGFKFGSGCNIRVSRQNRLVLPEKVV